MLYQFGFYGSVKCWSVRLRRVVLCCQPWRWVRLRQQNVRSLRLSLLSRQFTRDSADDVVLKSFNQVLLKTHPDKVGECDTPSVCAESTLNSRCAATKDIPIFHNAKK